MVTDGPPAWTLVVITGKLHQGETEAQAALREVPEETGLRCRLGREVGTGLRE
jgi:8-oxo-dGTP pyrophosphatase MutT (NUDIX family)